MKAKAHYQVGGEAFVVEAQRNDRSWGHCIDVNIYNDESRLWATTSFACHPEFLGYAKFQSMSTAELLAAAIFQLEQGAHGVLQSGHRAGIQVLFRLNDNGEGLACEYPPA